ncbi:MAG TPA: ribosome maturation factor RimP, partial [Cyclobacteriaceae bacterium]|nr:ribosome maturation factor RimP [Cyclobacteriaceae bacterium]
AHFVVDVVLTSGRGSGKLLVLVDGDQGISIDDCVEISRKLSEKLDETGIITEKYVLEVSSPGLDQPLSLHRQYVKNTGRNVKVHLLEGKVIEGKIAAVTSDVLVLEQTTGKGKKKDIKQLEISFSDIKKTLVTVAFK